MYGTNTDPKVLRITRMQGIAGNYALVTTVQYEDEEPSTVTFHGSTYGGPVVMESHTGAQVFVTSPERFGDTLTEEWVRSFFA